MGNIGPLEIGIVLVVALIVFGPKRLPELGNSLGKGLREFKGSISGDGDEPPPGLESKTDSSAEQEDQQEDHSAAETPQQSHQVTG